MNVTLLLSMIILPLMLVLLTVLFFILYFSREKPVREGMKVVVTLLIIAVAMINALPLAISLFGLWFAVIVAAVLYALLIPIVILIYR